MQGLRAVAVVLVVLYHLWPDRVSGGYVGVDVFFVISGYLITSHLYRELSTTGTVSLPRFWARRARRLLPASLLVLVVSGAGVLLLMPATAWAETARQIAASALYVQNWALAADAVDYMAADAQPTVAQHYWSLAVEEQFYLFWPVLLLGVAVLGRRAGSQLPVRAQLATGIAVVLAVSLVWSVVATYQDRSSAYFVTPTRVWELAAGGLLALMRLDDRLRGRRAAVVVAWLGLGAVALAGLTYDDGTMFPGWMALLPVLGTVAVMAAGTTPGRASAAHWLSLRPMTFIGDISYSVYLWHWPLLVLWPFATGVPLRTGDKLAVLGATVVLAWLSKVMVEDPARTGRLLRTSARTVGLTATGMAVVLLGSAAVVADVDRRADAAAERAEQAMESEAQDPCDGPAALSAGCDPPEGDDELVPPPEVVAVQNSDPPYPGCQQSRDEAEVATCVLGDADGPERVVAVVGDSHATMWFPALERAALERGWQVHTFTKSSCPMSRALRTLPDEQTTDAQDSCRTWVDDVMTELAVLPDLSVVVTAAFSTAYGFEAPPGVDMADPGTEGFTQVWDEVLGLGVEVVALADVPRTLGGRVPDCLAANPDDRMACAVPREQALPGSALVEAARQHEGVTLLDLHDQFCDAATCYPVVGDLIVYRDYSHLSAEYSRALAPLVGDALDQADGGPPVS